MKHELNPVIQRNHLIIMKILYEPMMLKAHIQRKSAKLI